MTADVVYAVLGAILVCCVVFSKLAELGIMLDLSFWRVAGNGGGRLDLFPFCID